MRLSPSFASLRGSVSTGVVGAASVALIAAAFWGHGVASAETAAACSQPGRVFIVGGTWNSDGSYLVGIEQRYTGHGAHWEELPDSPYSGAGAYEIEQVPYSATICHSGRSDTTPARPKGRPTWSRPSPRTSSSAVPTRRSSSPAIRRERGWPATFSPTSVRIGR